MEDGASFHEASVEALTKKQFDPKLVYIFMAHCPRV